MAQLAGLSASNSLAQHLAFRDFSSHIRGHSNHGGRADGGHERLAVRAKVRESIVQTRPATVTQPAELGTLDQLFASSSMAKLNFSSKTSIRQNVGTGETQIVERQSVNFKFSSSQIAVGNGNAADIGELLEGQTEVIEKLFDAAGLLGDFNTDFADEFLSRIREGLEGIGDTEGVSLQASSLDVKIKVQTRSVTVDDSEGGSLVEKSVQKISLKVRFVSLNVEGDVTEPQEPVEAEVADDQGTLDGLGPRSLFDFDGDGSFSFDDVLALADEVFDVGGETA